MANITHQYAKAATNLANIEQILGDLAVTFAEVQQRTTVDDSMIDALVASAGALSEAATALKSIDYTPPAPLPIPHPPPPPPPSLPL